MDLTLVTHPLKIRTLVDAILENLDCSQKTLCSLIGVTQTALSTSVEKPFNDASGKVGKRLLALLYVVETLKKDQSLNASLMMKVLVTPCYPLADGTFLDVASAIHEGTNRNEFLIDVADAALKFLRSKYEKEKWPIENGIYNMAIKERIR